jgi:hypothetical protein
MALVLGIAVAAVGAWGRRIWTIESDFETFGVIVLMSGGLFVALLGLYGTVREPRSEDPAVAKRQDILARIGWRATFPPVVAGATMIGFFALTDRWHELANPVQSQVALFAGVLGGLVGMLADRITRWDLIVVPVGLIVALLLWGDQLPFDSPTTTTGEIVALLIIAILIIGIAVNIPQVVRGRRPVQAAS